ncbi:peptidase M42 [Clostridium aestuarii]|uniref:Peptidase M42 n=1 Tax=Clostridium aestuarii TaxID=338193 RepID=A0ABT4D3T1_9CLOT|nr:peptidase M42 [Clostridium aestuarii]MCY6485910.1 peptidase M42 [Clostridium aestuarii]
MDKVLERLLERLLDTFSVSGREQKVREVIKEELNSMASPFEIKEDKMGNLIVKLGSGDTKVMLCTSMDNSGVMATFIEDNGLIRVSPVGDFSYETLVGNFARFENGVLGRIGSAKDKPSENDLFIDIGVSSRQEALKKVNEGDIAEFIGNKLEVENKIIASNLHNKLGCYALLQIIKELESTDKELYFVFTAEDKVGYRGARAAAFEIKPDMCIVIGSIKTGDTIGAKGKIKVEGGPVTSIFDKGLVIDHEIKENIEKAAEKLNIKLQYSIDDGKNQGGLIHKEVGGIKTGMIGIPCRYKDTIGEMISLKDVEDTVKLIKKLI